MSPINLAFSPTPLKKLKTVYVIDDNATEREMLVDFFSRYPGLIVTGFTNGDECVKQIVMSHVSPDMILLDYFLDAEVSTSKDGLEILTKLSEISPDSSIIMHTGVENKRIIDLARKKGAYDYVIKGPEGYKKLEQMIGKEFVISE